VTAVGGWPKPEFCFMPRQLRWTLLPKERYGNSLNGRGSNTQPSNWEADTLSLSYCHSLLNTSSDDIGPQQTIGQVKKYKFT